MTSVYSKAPLSKKLGLKSGHTIFLVNPPKHYFELFNEFPEDIKVLKKAKEKSVNFIHAFFKTQIQLDNALIGLKELLHINGMLWVSWPKGSSKIETNLNRDLIRDTVLSIGLVDVKVAAVDDDWSGLKFVYRLKDRK